MADSTMKLSLQKNEKELNILERRMDQFQESMERNFEQSSAQIAAMGNQIIQLSQKLQTTSEEVAQKIIEAINAFRRSEKEKLTPSEVSCDQSSEVPAMQDYSVPFSGGDPCEFIRGYEEFFKLNPMTEIDMIQYVMQDFEGEALEWYYKYVEENFLDTWTPDCWGDFVAEIYRKFSELKTMLPYDEEIEAAADLTEVGDCNVFQTEIENLNQNQQVFNQLDHLKVNSLPRYDSSFPNLAANIEAGVLFANKKEMGVEGKVFDKNPEPSDYTNALNLKPPDGYDIRRKTMKEVDNGVEVKGGEPLIVKLGAEMTLHLSQACPGEVKKGKGLESICLFVNVEGKKLVLGTLSPEKLPQQLDLVLDRDFEPTHNWKNESVFVYGYKVDKSNDETGNEDEYESESEEDFPRIAANNGKPPAQVKQEKLIADEKVNAVKDSAVVLGGSEFSLVVIDEVESFALIFDPGGGIISTSSYFRLDHNSHALNSLIFMLIDMGVVCCYNTVHCLSKLGLMGCLRENFTEMINAKSSVVFFVPTNVDVQVKFISKGTHENWNLIIASFDEIIYDLISNEEKSLSTVGILLQNKLEYRNCALGVLIRVTDKTLWDLSSNFIFIENDVGKNRTLASVPKLQELNYVVVVSTLTTTLTKVQLSDFQAVVFTDIDLENAIAFNDYCHNHQPSIAFIKTEVSSLFGNVLCDFGPEFTVVDVDSEERHTGMIASISNDKPALVSCVYDEGLEFQDGDLLVFSKVRGMAKLNAGKSRKVVNTRPYSFSLEEDILNFGPYERGGRFPVAGSEKDAQKLISIASNIYESFGDAKLSNLNPKCLRHFPFGVWAVLNPMAAMFGGIIGQEVMTAYSEKFHPLFQFFYFDSVESLPAKPLEPSDFKPLNSRYVAQILVFWPKLLEYAQVFVVRSGALVCEFLKKLALMGVSYNNLITLLCAILFTSGEYGRTCVEQLLHLLGQIDQYVSLSVEYQRRRGCLAGNEMLLKFHTLGVAGYCSRGCLGSCTHNKKVDYYLHRISNLPSAFTLPSRNALCLGDRIVVCLPHCADTISEVRKVYAQIVDQLFTMQTLILGVKDLFKDWGIVKNWEQGEGGKSRYKDNSN